MADWRGQHIQFVWFLADVEGLVAAEVFRRVWATEPEQTQQNRAPNPSNPFLSVASTAVSGLTSQVQIQPGRIDVLLVAEPGQEDQSVFKSLFDLNQHLLALVEGITAKQAVDRDAFRLSAVATLLKPVDTYNDGVKEFTNSLGFDFAISNPSDLMFQVNSRKIIGGINMNRVLQISTMGFQTFNLPLMAGAPIPGPGSTATQYAARRHLDFNTAPDGKLLERTRHAPIFKALADELRRVARNGTLEALRT
ncbi:hypothetical protein [Mesorhizobium sp.]|uniref:hypothetical protein n=1 Tax=Mesorhizobium sp. TaxID=1871066 RepID=UPI0025BCE1AC|nr:hypothetical protein [Mesorhizobium sp.]